MNQLRFTNNMPGALDGISVLELTKTVAGAIASMFLSDNGAHVVRLIEDEQSTLRNDPGFALWDRGKEAVIIDAADSHSIEKFANWSDVTIDDAQPTADTASLIKKMIRVNGNIIQCTISGYGNAGPSKNEPPDPDLVLARTGILGSQPSFRNGPIHVIHPIANVGTGLLAALGTTAAFLHRERTGEAQRVETSLMAGSLLYSPKATSVNLNQRSFRSTPAGGGPFYSVFQYADGKWIQLGCIHSGFVDLAASVMGIADILTNPEFGDGRFPQTENARKKLFDIVANAMVSKTSSGWAKIFEAYDIPFALIKTCAQAIDDPQVRHNNMVIEGDPIFGRTALAELPISLSRTPSSANVPRASVAVPAIDWLNKNPIPSDRLNPYVRHKTSTLPLENIKVLEIANVIAGPIASRLLADLGADVVKLESLSWDISRPNATSGFMFCNANKRSISVNTRTPEGRKIAHRLAASHDVILANMRPGATNRMGLSCEKLTRLSPKLIETHITAFGWTGPYAHRPGVDPLAQAITGLQHAQGDDDCPPFLLSALAPCDYTGGAMAALGTVLALFVRHHTGFAQQVHTNLLNSGIIMSTDGFMRAVRKPQRLTSDRHHYGLNALHRLYQTSDSWIYVAAKIGMNLLELHQSPDFQIPTGDLKVTRESNVKLSDEDLSRLLSTVFLGQPTRKTHQILRRASIPSTPVVYDYATSFYTDRQALANGHVSQIKHPNFGILKIGVNVVTFNNIKHEIRRPTPLLGQHTEEILAEFGYESNTIQSLEKLEVIKTELPYE